MKSTMRSEVFMREDLAAILRAVNSAQWGLAQHMPQTEVAVFRAGFVSALKAIATAVHVQLDLDDSVSLLRSALTVSRPADPAEAPELLPPVRPLRVIGDPFWAEDNPRTIDSSEPDS
jgi:hypothetical protein